MDISRLSAETRFTLAVIGLAMENGWRQKEIAEALGVTEQQVNRRTMLARNEIRLQQRELDDRET